MTANNDAQITVFDAEKFACLNQFNFDWSVNVSNNVGLMGSTNEMYV